MSIINFPDTFKQQDTENGRLCFVLCKDTQINYDLIVKAVADEFGAEVEIREEDHDHIYFITLPDCQQAFFSFMSVPVPDREAEESAENNLYWPEADKELAGYDSHVIVGITSGPENKQTLNILLTRMARVALQAFSGLGVYWGAGAITHSRDIFMLMTDDLKNDPCPLNVWMRFQLLREDNNKISLYTVGLSQFGLNEIEVKPCNWKPSDLLELVFNVSRYLVEEGAVINDGDTVGGDENERIVVRHAKGMYATDERVYRIMMEAL